MREYSAYGGLLCKRLVTRARASLGGGSVTLTTQGEEYLTTHFVQAHVTCRYMSSASVRNSR